MLKLLRERKFGVMWCAHFISVIGDWVLFATLPFFAYQLTNSALATGTLFVAQVMPGVVLGPIAGVLVDRWNRQRALIVCDLLRAAVLPALLLVSSRQLVWLIYIVALIESSVSRFSFPAMGALMPRLVGRESLSAANSLNAFSSNLARFIGPSLGGGLMAWYGLRGIVFADSVSYLISAAMIFSVQLAPSNEPLRVGPPSGTPTLAGLARECAIGFRTIRQSELIRRLFAVAALGWMADGAVTVLIVVFVVNAISSRPDQFGMLLSARGLGGIIGGLLIAQVSTWVSESLLLTVGLGSAGILLAIIVATRSFAVALPAMALAGVTATAWLVSEYTLLQRSVPDRQRGRLLGAFDAWMAASMLLGMSIASALGDVVGAAVILQLASAVYGAAACLSMFVTAHRTEAVKEDSEYRSSQLHPE